MSEVETPRLTEERLAETKARAQAEIDRDELAYEGTNRSLANDALTLASEIERCVEVLRSIIWASDHCQGHRDCAHSMSPWLDARELLYEFDNEQEALTELRRNRHGDFGR